MQRGKTNQESKLFLWDCSCTNLHYVLHHWYPSWQLVQWSTFLPGRLRSLSRTRLTGRDHKTTIKIHCFQFLLGRLHRRNKRYANFGIISWNFYFSIISIGNSMICSDISHKYHEWYFEIVIRKKFETILKYYEWYLCQILRTNHKFKYKFWVGDRNPLLWSLI